MRTSKSQLGKKHTAQARATIAVACEMITGSLDKLSPSDQLAAAMEIHRRMTRRLETICEKINEEATKHRGE